MINRLKVACFTGHRKLPSDCAELRAELEKAVTKLIEQGVIFFGNGGAVGFDILAAETVLHLKQQYPQIRLIMILPCPPEQQSLKWNEEQKKRYYKILAQSDKIRILSPRYTDGCMLARNRYMVDNSGHLVCYLRRQQGGTFYTVSYAERQGINIIKL